MRPAPWPGKPATRQSPRIWIAAAERFFGKQEYGHSERRSAANAADGRAIEMIRSHRAFACLKLCSGLLLPLAAVPRPAAQDETSRFRVNVVLVQLNVAVTDGKGNYIPHLRPEDFVIKE